MAKYLNKDEYKQKLKGFFNPNLDAAAQFDIIEEALAEHEKLLNDFNSAFSYNEETDTYVSNQSEESQKYMEQLKSANEKTTQLESELFNLKKQYEERFFGREISGGLDDPRTTKEVGISSLFELKEV